MRGAGEGDADVAERTGVMGLEHRYTMGGIIQLNIHSTKVYRSKRRTVLFT